MEQGQRNFRRRISVARANTIQVDENDEIPEFKNFKDLRRETLFATSTAMIKRSNAVNKIKEQEEEVKVITPYTKLEKCFRQCKEISLAYQISFYLILSTFTISALIVLLSTVNLSWLREWQIEIASDLLVDSVDRQIIDYAEQIGNEYSNRLQSRSLHLIWLCQLFTAVLDRRGGSVPTESTDIPLYWHNQIPDSVLDYAPAFPTTPVTYDFPALYTPHSTISDEGIDIFDSLRVINILIPQLFHGSFMYMYLGFPFDDLYFQYPGMPLPPGYFAISRSWMLGAIESEGEVYMTEPYQDTFSGGWMVSVTKAVYNKDGTLRYVAGVDFYLKFLFEAIGKVKILDDGFAAIIANGGLIVSEVDDDIWSSEEGILSRVFADEMTGIDIYDYIEMRDQDIVIDATWSFETPSGKEAYHWVRNFVRDQYGHILYMVIVAVSDDQVIEILDFLKDGFDAMYEYLSWLARSIAIFLTIYFPTMIILWALYLSSQFTQIRAQSQKLLLYSNWTMITKRVNKEELKITKDMNDALNKLKIKFREAITKLKISDKIHYIPYPEQRWSRPDDDFEYMDWYEKDYSRNKIKKQYSKWTKKLDELIDSK